MNADDEKVMSKAELIRRMRKASPAKISQTSQRMGLGPISAGYVHLVRHQDRQKTGTAESRLIAAVNSLGLSKALDIIEREFAS